MTKLYVIFTDDKEDQLKTLVFDNRENAKTYFKKILRDYNISKEYINLLLEDFENFQCIGDIFPEQNLTIFLEETSLITNEVFVNKIDLI